MREDFEETKRIKSSPLSKYPHAENSGIKMRSLPRFIERPNEKVDVGVFRTETLPIAVANPMMTSTK